MVTNMVKEEFKDIELHDGGSLNLMVIRDTQSSRIIDFRGYTGSIFLDLWFQRCATCLQWEIASYPAPVITQDLVFNRFSPVENLLC